MGKDIDFDDDIGHDRPAGDKWSPEDNPDMAHKAELRDIDDGDKLKKFIKEKCNFISHTKKQFYILIEETCGQALLMSTSWDRTPMEWYFDFKARLDQMDATVIREDREEYLFYPVKEKVLALFRYNLTQSVLNPMGVNTAHRQYTNRTEEREYTRAGDMGIEPPPGGLEPFSARRFVAELMGGRGGYR